MSLWVSLLILLSFTQSMLAATTANPPAEFPYLTKLVKQGGDVSALLVDLHSGQTLASLDANQRLTPASLSKLVLAAAALDTWGPNKRFTTDLYYQGQLAKSGILTGNLIVRGEGDADLTNDQLWRLANEVKRAGISKVTGNLIINNQDFGPIGCVTVDRCQAKTSSSNAYAGRLAATSVNYSIAGLAIIPAKKAGQPARLSQIPFAVPSIKVKGKITTSRATKRPTFQVKRLTKAGTDYFTISGSVPAKGGSYQVYRAVSNPSRYSGELLKAFLQQAGVTVKGNVEVSFKPVPQQAELLLQFKGAPLKEQIGKVLTFSNNYMADMLAIKLWLTEHAGQTNGSTNLLTEAGLGLENYLTDLTQSSNGLQKVTLGQGDKDSLLPIVMSGSGLTPANRLSATDIVSVLAHIYQQTDLFPSFLAGLVVPNNSKRGIFRRGSDDWLKRIQVKTGSLTQPRPVFGLAGYLRLRNGHWGAFAVITNGLANNKQQTYPELQQAVKADMEKLLDRF